MALRAGHGLGAGVPRIEVLPADEQPQPVPTHAAAPSVALSFRRDGKIADSATAKALGAKGGRAKAGKVRLADSNGLSSIVAETTFGPFNNAGDDFTRAHLVQLAGQAGGAVGPAASSMVASAGLQLAASRWAFSKAAETGDPALYKLGSTLANDSRQNLLAAYELAVREAKARGTELRPHALAEALDEVDT